MNNRVFEDFLDTHDAAHDLEHIKRVVKSALKFCNIENADKEIVQAAAWLHDCVMLPKNHPERKKTSKLAAEKASGFLKEINFPVEKIRAVSHAIESHSFSAGITPETIEAKIVQDADRLDALGAIGIARCFMVGGLINRPLYNPDDPFCESREPDDGNWNIDHFYKKLFKLPEMMNTATARAEAEKRVEFMNRFLEQLGRELNTDDDDI